jgi:Membrane protein TerC, possibly involved in tellurium resistance
MIASIWLWVGFSLFILAMLALDLGVFHRKAQPVSSKEALGWTAIWVTLALLFGAGVWHFAGQEKALEFYTGWLIEYSLSVDNVFVFALIFSYFAVPPAWQHKVLFWGILGALVMRLAMIGAGVTLMARFSWVLYLFGAFLIFTGIRMAFRRTEQIHPERNPVVRWFRKCVPVTRDYHGDFRGAPRRSLGGHAVTGGAGLRGNNRPAVRHRFHSSHLRGHTRPVHCLFVDCLCHSGPAVTLLRVGWSDKPVSLPEARLGHGARVRRREDAAGTHGVEN